MPDLELSCLVFPPFGLSEMYWAQGLSNKEIAYHLSLGEKTVKTHVSNILGKLGVQSRTQAALYAVRHGLIPPASLGQGA